MRTFVVAGTSSGVGTTSVAVGLMAAFTRRGLRVQPFKIGPDFLDPMHHYAATGRHSYNLDGWMLSREANLACFRARAADADVAIVEGVMGLFDGRDGKSDAGSTAEMAKLLSAPVLLVLDCWALARSAAALVRGFTTFDPALAFSGVVFNKVGSPAHTAWLTDAVLTTEPNIRILGGLPKTASAELPNAHHPLRDSESSGSSAMSWSSIQQLADLVEQHIDLDAVLESASAWEPPSPSPTLSSNGNGSAESEEAAADSNGGGGPPSPTGKHVRIGVARDDAFCFYYQANLHLLQEAGAEVVYFSPLRDALPPRLDAIILGGGHPERHAPRLAANKPLLYAVRAFALAGGIVYGECGGLMYLSHGIEGSDGEFYPMCGVFPFATRTQPVRHEGYVKVTPRRECVLFPASSVGEIRGQVCHSSEVFFPASNQVADCPRGLAMRMDCYDSPPEQLEGYMRLNAMASFAHLHFGSNASIAPAFVARCRGNAAKGASVAAASASAVAGAGPVAAAAAGAAAAAAVAAALGDHAREKVRSLAQSVSSDSIFESPGGPIRRSESLDAMRSGHGDLGFSPAKLVRSGSEVWGGSGEPDCGGQSPLAKSFGDFREAEACGRTKPPRVDGHAGGGSDGLLVCSASSGGVPLVRVKTGSLSGNRKVDLVEGDGARQASGRPRNGKKYSLDANRHPSSGARIGKPSNGRARAPERIVSLLPAATEILVQIGAGARLIAVTDMCDRPPGVKTRRQVVCSSKVDIASMSSKNVDFALKALAAKKESYCRLDVSWLSRAKPDLIISQDICEQCEIHDATLTSMLAKAGVVSRSITKLVALGPKTVTEMLASITALGEAVNLYPEACLLVDSLRARLRRVAAAVATQDRPRALLLQGMDPLQLGGHWAFEMVTLAGGSEGLQKPGCPPETLHFRRLAAYAPEVLVLAPRCSNLDRSLAEMEIVGRAPEFWSIPAVERREVYICDHSCFSFPGPRLVEGVELLAHILHPAAFKELQGADSPVLKFSLPAGQRCRPEDLAQHFHPLQRH